MTNPGKDVLVYLAIRHKKDRSRFEDVLVLDGFNVSSFPSAAALWKAFQQRPARIVITDRRFPDGLGGLELARNIRQQFPLPYAYIVTFSQLNRLEQIEEGLAAGVDDYLIKPLHPFQLRTRILVGLRWLAYVDQNAGPSE